MVVNSVGPLWLPTLCISEMPVIGEQAQERLIPVWPLFFVNQGEQPERFAVYARAGPKLDETLDDDFGGSLGRNNGSHGLLLPCFY